MLGVTTPHMVAEVCNCSALGTLPLGGLSALEADRLIVETKKLTNKPFIVNLFLNPIVAFTSTKYLPVQHFLQLELAKIGFAQDIITDVKQNHYTELIPVLLAHNISHISFTFGVFTQDEIQLFHDHNITLIGTATTLDEVKHLHDAAIDIIILQGLEAGGHRGSYLKQDLCDNLLLHDFFDLVMASNISTPIAVAGGLSNGKEAVYYLNNGASYAVFGSLYIASDESNALQYQKNLLHKGVPIDTTLTKAFSGKWARGIPNDFTRLFEQKDELIAPYPIQNDFTKSMRIFAREQNKPDYYSMWCGQKAHYARKSSTKQITQQLIKEIYE